MKISCKFGEPSWCSFPLSVNAENLSTPPVDTINLFETFAVIKLFNIAMYILRLYQSVQKMENLKVPHRKYVLSCWARIH